MKMIKALVLALQECPINNGEWPDGATECTAVSKYSVEFDEEVTFGYDTHAGEIESFQDSIYELEHVIDYDEYGDYNIVTKEEYLEFCKDNPHFNKGYLQEIQKNVIVEMETVNKEIAALVNKLSKLAESVDLEVVVDLGVHGSLDVNGDWNDSRC